MIQCLIAILLLVLAPQSVAFLRAANEQRRSAIGGSQHETLGMRDSTRYTYTGQLICKKEKSATIELLG
jgi:hypothetical protein